MINPNEFENLKNENYNIDEIILEIDNKIKEYAQTINNFYPWVEIIIYNEYQPYIRNKIGQKYINSGWSVVCHQTSSENEEIPGLTTFVFCTKETYKQFFDAYTNSKSKWWVIANTGDIYTFENKYLKQFKKELII